MAHPDLDQLVNDLLTVARNLLDNNGEFYPFGAFLDDEGKVQLSTSDGSERPASPTLIEHLTEAFQYQAKAGNIRPCGICFDVLVPLPGNPRRTDAVQCRLEHKNGEAANVYLPCTKGFFGSIKYGQLFAVKASASSSANSSYYDLWH